MACFLAFSRRSLERAPTSSDLLICRQMCRFSRTPAAAGPSPARASSGEPPTACNAWHAAGLAWPSTIMATAAAVLAHGPAAAQWKVRAAEGRGKYLATLGAGTVVVVLLLLLVPVPVHHLDAGAAAAQAQAWARAVLVVRKSRAWKQSAPRWGKAAGRLTRGGLGQGRCGSDEGARHEGGGRAGQGEHDDAAVHCGRSLEERTSKGPQKITHRHSGATRSQYCAPHTNI